MSAPTAVILAGGFGTRVKHLLPNVPKPMAPVLGKPFLEWVVRYLSRHGIKRNILSTGHLAELVEEHFRKQPVTAVTTICVRETEPLGTGGGFLHAVRSSGETAEIWLVANGDSLAFGNLTEAINNLRDSSMGGLLIGCAVADASRYGTMVSDANGQLLRFEEKRPGRGIINAGIYLLKDSIVQKCVSWTSERTSAQEPPSLSFEQDIFPRLLREGMRLKVFVVEGPFLDIGTPETLREAEEFVAQNRAQFA